jgi:hypothetical protein
MPAEKLGSFAALDGQSVPSDGQSATSDGQSVPSDGKSVPTPRTLTPAFPPALQMAPRTPLATEAARKRSRYADMWESMAQGNGHMSNQGEPSHHPRLINPPAVSSSQVLRNDQQRENTSDHISLPVFRQRQVQGCAFPPTLPPGIGLGELTPSLHNSSQNYGAPVSYNQLQQPIEVQQRLARMQSQTGIGYISVAPPLGLEMGLGAYDNGVYGQYYNQNQQHRAQDAYNQYQLQPQRQQLIQQEHHQQQRRQQQPYPQTQSPLAQEFTTATPTEQNAPTDFASGGNLSNRRWRSPPSTGRPRRVYIPAPSLSTNNRELVREHQASVPNRFSTPVRATSAAVVCPTRQPRGPPPIEVLLTKPTSQHEGSKNFAARGRRRQSSGFVSTGVASTTSGNTTASVSVSGIGTTGVTRTTSINTAAASISGIVSTGVARTTSGNTSAAAVSGTTAPIFEHGGLVSEDTKNVASSAANRNGR